MAAYLIVNYEITDPDLYKEYMGGAAPALKVGSESKLVVLDTESTVLEGDYASHQTVVLEFESMEKAKEIYESGEYQAVVGKRLAASKNHFAVIVNGMA